MPSVHLNLNQMSIFESMAKKFKPNELITPGDNMTKRELFYLVMGKLSYVQQETVMSWIKPKGDEVITLYNISQDQSYWLLQAILKRDNILGVPIEVVKNLIRRYI